MDEENELVHMGLSLWNTKNKDYKMNTCDGGQLICIPARDSASQLSMMLIGSFGLPEYTND